MGIKTPVKNGQNESACVPQQESHNALSRNGVSA